MNKDLFNLIRKSGFYDVMSILYRYKDHVLGSRNLTFELQAIGSYYNSYLRVKKEMIRFKLIEYYLNESYLKCIRLTPRGVSMWEKIGEINDMLEDPEHE